MFTIQGVSLPDPELGNTESLLLKAKVDRARNGARRSTIKRGQGKDRTYVFNAVKPSTYQSLRSAISANSTLAIVDHESTSFNAILTKSTFITSSRDDFYTITLELRSL